MSYSDTSAAKRYASIAEVAAAECKNLTEEARKAPQYTDDARKAAQDAEAAATAATSAASSAQISFNGSSQNAIIAQSAASSASADASLAQASELAAKQSEISAADSATTAVAAVNKTIRSPDTDLSPLPSVADRKGKLCAFDSNGNVIASVPASGSATEVYETLAGPDGATYVHYGTQTVADVLSTVGDKISGALTFTAGGTVNTTKDFVYDSATKSWYYWSGTFPFTFAASSSPSSSSSWLCAGDSVITSKLASSNYGTGIVSTILPLAGAVSRTQKDRNQDWISVKDFGATGDGTTDDTAAFKNALASSYQVFVPQGHYKITDALKPRDGTYILGAGKFFTWLELHDVDVDLITLGWDCILEGMSLDSKLPDSTGYSRGLLRLQSLTNPEIPPPLVALGGLSYRNKIRDVALWNGQTYNMYGFGLGYTEWHNSDSLLARGPSSIYLDGSEAFGAKGTTFYMTGVNKVTACRGGDGIGLNNQFAIRIWAIIEGNKGRAVSVFGTADDIQIDGYFENNFAPAAGGSGNGDAVVKFETGLTRGCLVKGYIDTLNASYPLQIHALATGFNNKAEFFSRENATKDYENSSGFSNLSGAACGWQDNNFLRYFKEADLGQTRNAGKLTFNQCLTYSPYSIVPNTKFDAWSGATPDSWSGSCVKMSHGYAGSSSFVRLNSYPSTYIQCVDIQNYMERNASNYNLVIVGRNGHTISSSSPEFNGTSRTLLIIGTPSGNVTLGIPQLEFSAEWTMNRVDLSTILAGDFPNKSNITGITLMVYGTNGIDIGMVALFDNSAGNFIPANK